LRFSYQEAISFTFYAVRNTAKKLWLPFPCSFSRGIVSGFKKSSSCNLSLVWMHVLRI